MSLIEVLLSVFAVALALVLGAVLAQDTQRDRVCKAVGFERYEHAYCVEVTNDGRAETRHPYLELLERLRLDEPEAGGRVDTGAPDEERLPLRAR